MTREMDLFDAIMSQRDKISEGVYKATTSKRLKTVPPASVRIYDTDLDTWFTGNGSSAGGVAEAGNGGVRTITVAAAASGMAQVTATQTGDDTLFTEAKVGQLRTGDGLTLAAGTGSVPGGLSAAEYWIIKGNDESSSQFKLASSRVNALAGSGNYITSSGEPGYTSVISTVCSDRSEDVMYVKAAANVTVCLPYEAASEKNAAITVKKSGQAGVVTVSGLGSTGAVSGLDYDGNTGSSIALRTNERDQCTLFLDTDGDEYVSTSIVNS